MNTPRTLIIITLSLLGAGIASAQNFHPSDTPLKKEYSPYIEDNFPTQALFGDTHRHTSWSTDAGMIGTTLGPDGNNMHRVVIFRDDTDTSLDRIRCEILRRQDAFRYSNGIAGAGLHLADLV